MKAIKISPSNKITVVDNWQTDPDNVNNLISGYTLSLLEFWEHRKYKLSVFMVDTFEAKHAFNPIATRLYRKLKYTHEENEQAVFGFMIICNEDEDKELDFALDDYHYILSKLDNITYVTGKRTFDWDNFLAREYQVSLD